MAEAPEYITYNPVYGATYEGADPARGYVYLRADMSESHERKAALLQIGSGCGECCDNVCTMNCSGSIAATQTEWIAASIWAGVFPHKAVSSQVIAWRASLSTPTTGEKR